ncbi:polyprenyl synthetase family protein [Saccharibacillus endophyticus]|uniref:Serralysin n=1 Tax=Saccharibacillus endophyticus TaxID=2060666 RepID=A0ABQ1ZXV7_9BACL|nr:polyprenyl synthetase family protein [Saccharibacillus endophyticus]GGH82031.1 serralysin [Saccharibacillus endophyticus]
MNWNEAIKQTLMQGIEQGFNQDELREMAAECAAYKLSEKALFGNLTVLHYRMYGGEGDGILQAAAAVEALVLSLDMIDDLQDGDNESAPWSKFRSDLALNIALGFSFLAQQMLLQAPFPSERKYEAAALLNAQLLTTVNGQMTDLLNAVYTEEQYMEMISGKSASLLVMAVQLGTLLGCGQTKIESAEFALQLGIAAQIKNDILDITNHEGKNDFWNRKRTLPVLMLLNYLEGENHWATEYFEGKLSYDEVKTKATEFEEVLEQSGALAYASVRMRLAYYRCLDVIESLPAQSEFKRILDQTIRL